MSLTTVSIKQPKPLPSGFTVHGKYGVLMAWPDGEIRGPVQERTYWVDSTFMGSDGKPIHERQHGFRLSTVVCMCACICLGEEATDMALMQQVSQYFEQTAAMDAPQELVLT